jgi:hypothetical protein
MDCPAGQTRIGPTGDACQDCPAGMLNPEVAPESVCNLCPVGMYSAPGSANCVACEAGTHSAELGSASCSPCPAGTIQPGTGATECDECAPGSFSVEGAAVCERCPAGRVSESQGATVCRECTPGTVSPTTGATACDVCPAGSFAPNTTACETCPDQTYSEAEGATICSECPQPSVVSETRTACNLCPAGEWAFFSSSTAVGVCQPCPSGFSCDGAANAALVPGFWSPGGPADGAATPCSTPAWCPGGALNQNPCVAGRTGFLCGACDAGFYARNDQCIACPDNSAAAVAFAVAIFVVLAFLGFAVLRFSNRVEPLIIGFQFLQIIAISIRVLSIDWTVELLDLLRWLAVLMLSVEAAAPECTVPWFTYTVRWWAATAAPFILCGSVFLVRGAMRLCCRRQYRQSPHSETTLFHEHEAPTSFLSTAKSDAYAVLNGLALIIIDRAVAAFDCTKQEESAAAGSLSGKWSMDDYPLQQCYTVGSAEWLSMAAGGGALLLALAVCFPVYCAQLELPNELDELPPWLLAATCKFWPADLYYAASASRRERWARKWELVIFSRKVLFVCAALLVSSRVHLQLGAIIALFIAAFAAQLCVRPYADPLCEAMERLSLAMTVVFLALVLLVHEGIARRPLSFAAAAAVFAVPPAAVALALAGAVRDRRRRRRRVAPVSTAAEFDANVGARANAGKAAAAGGTAQGMAARDLASGRGSAGCAQPEATASADEASGTATAATTAGVTRASASCAADASPAATPAAAPAVPHAATATAPTVAVAPAAAVAAAAAAAAAVAVAQTEVEALAVPAATALAVAVPDTAAAAVAVARGSDA